jgi:steroid delta-isomerase-like uncharacterized protein
MTDANKSIIGAFIEEDINQGQLGRANDLVKEDFIELDPLPGQRQGRKGLKAILPYMRTAFLDIHWDVDEMGAEGEKVVTRFHWNGTHKGTFLGIPASGRSVTVVGVVIDRLDSEKIPESRILMDTLGMMQELGAIPALAAPS